MSKGPERTDDTSVQLVQEYQRSRDPGTLLVSGLRQSGSAQTQCNSASLAQRCSRACTYYTGCSPSQQCSASALMYSCALAGPVVRATVDRAKDQIILQANLSTEGAEKKKTIAQYIDEALEQEFPEDKSGDGKNYNATAKQEDVRPAHTPVLLLCVPQVPALPCRLPAEDTCSHGAQPEALLPVQATVETVIKVSSKQKEREKDAEQPPPPAPAAKHPPPQKAKGGWGWHTEHSPPPPPPPAPVKTAEPEGKAKDKPKHRKQEAAVESEVDRLIDSQDNVYVLSRPKCAGAWRGAQPCALLLCSCGACGLRAWWAQAQTC